MCKVQMMALRDNLLQSSLEKENVFLLIHLRMVVVSAFVEESRTTSMPFKGGRKF